MPKQNSHKSEEDEPKPRFLMMFTEGCLLGFIEMFNRKKANIQKLLELWRKPLLDASETQFVKELISRGLLCPRIDNGKIMLSYIEIIYVEMLRIVFEFGGNPKILKSLKYLFDEQYSDGFTTGYTPLAEILASGHAGLDIEFAYSANDEEITIYDYIFAAAILGRPKSGIMQFSLIPILNRVRKMSKNLQPIKTVHSMYDGLDKLSIEKETLTDSEKKVIEKMRHLEDTKTLSIKRKSGTDKYVMGICGETSDNELNNDIRALCRKYGISEYSDLSIKNRNGGVANVKISEREII